MEELFAGKCPDLFPCQVPTIPFPKLTSFLRSLPTRTPEVPISLCRRHSFQNIISELDRCTSIFNLRPLHATILKTQFPRNPFLLTRVAHAYIRLNHLSPAKQILTKFITRPPLFLWNETIKGYAKLGIFSESIHLYHLMTSSGVKPNEFTFSFVLPACAGARSISDGRKIHIDATTGNFDSNVFVATSIIDMYGKCGDVKLAREVFEKMQNRGTATFNAMIAGGPFPKEIDIP